jgi:single-stranded-DNA-specific exonuclease
MRPVFLSENVQIANSPRIVGTNHLLLTLKQNGSDKVFDCIGFDMGNLCEGLDNKNAFYNVVFTIDKTIRDGRTYPQFKFKDIKINENNQELD